MEVLFPQEQILMKWLKWIIQMELLNQFADWDRISLIKNRLLVL